MGWFRDVFKNFATENGIETAIWCGNCRDITDQVNATGVPPTGLQSLCQPPPRILVKILTGIVQVTTELLIFQFSCSSVKNAQTLRYIR